MPESIRQLPAIYKDPNSITVFPALFPTDESTMPPLQSIIVLNNGVHSTPSASQAHPASWCLFLKIEPFSYGMMIHNTAAEERAAEERYTNSHWKYSSHTSSLGIHHICPTSSSVPDCCHFCWTTTAFGNILNGDFKSWMTFHVPSAPSRSFVSNCSIRVRSSRCPRFTGLSGMIIKSPDWCEYIPPVLSRE